MKKRMIPAAALVSAAMIFTGCGAQTGETAQPAETAATEASSVATEQQAEAAVTESETAAEETETQTMTMAYEDPANLPVYTYQGTEEYLDVISDYMVKEYAKNFGDGADVFIPYSFIVEKDETDPSNILVYGEYDIDGYELRNTTLVSSCGARNRGVFHLKKDDNGTVTITEAELPETDNESMKLFEPVKNAYAKLTALTDEDITACRATAIAEYVNTNGLNILQWQDYGKSPVAILNAPETPEEDQFYAYESPLGYGIAYDLRAFTLHASPESDLYGKVEEDYTGTFMDVKKVTSIDPVTALNNEISEKGASDVTVTDASIGDGVACSQAEWEEKLDDGRSFLYMGYAVPDGEDTLVLMMEITCEEGADENTAVELGQLFASTLATFHLD